MSFGDVQRDRECLDRAIESLEKIPNARTLAAIYAPPMPSRLMDHAVRKMDGLSLDESIDLIAKVSARYAQCHADALLRRLAETQK